MSLILTDEQTAIVAAAFGTADSLMIEALAGCAKTKTLELIAHALPAVRTLALAFNRKTKDELEARLPRHVEVKTLNGLGHSAWGRTIGRRLILDDKKIGGLTTKVLGEAQEHSSSDDWDYVRQMVGKAMHSGLVPEGFAGKHLVPDAPEVWEELALDQMGVYDKGLCGLAREVLRRSIRLSISGTICYDDQIYMSCLFGGLFPTYPIVLVDEAQDLSPLNHIQLQRVSPGTSGRLIVVGDRHQSIYAWRGAATESMARIRGLKPNWQDLTLSQTFRVPRLLVARQHEHVPAFKAHESVADGFFLKLRRPAELELDAPFWSWKDIAELRSAQQCSSVAILCRNNAPLFKTAFRLLRQGVGVSMLGRDIGKTMVTLLKKLCPAGDLPLTDCVAAIKVWKEGEMALAEANQNERRRDAAADRAESLLAVCESAQGLTCQKDILVALQTLLANPHERVQLSTIHKAKGLEWDLVLLLDPWRIPSKRSLDNPVALQQELNLRYVAETRAKRVLLHANADDLLTH